MGAGDGTWWLPGVLIATLGVFAFVAGFVTGGPDMVGGLVFGSVALAAAAVILWRRAPCRSTPEPRASAEPGSGSGKQVR